MEKRNGKPKSLNFCKKEKESRGWREAKTGGIAGVGRDGGSGEAAGYEGRGWKVREEETVVEQKEESETDTPNGPEKEGAREE